MRFGFLIFFVVIMSVSYADEFVIRSFSHAQTDVSALRFMRQDANDQVCAIIKVRTDLRGLSFDAGKNLVGDIAFKNGEFWLYVSPGESRITIYKEGFITKHYLLPIAIEPSKVYVLEVTNKQTANTATGSLIIVTDPPGAVVKLRELSWIELITPDTLLDKPPFPYSATINKFRHNTIDTILAVHPGEMITHYISLTPAWGDVLIDVEPEDAEIFIDNDYAAMGDYNFVGDANGIDVGHHIISIRRERYYPQEQPIEVLSGLESSLKFKLQPMLGVLKMETPHGATLHIDGKMAGTVPFTDTLLTGSYQITLSAPGFLDMGKTITITENNTTYVNEVLQQSRRVKITSEPEQAEIYLDGNYMATTPATIAMGYGSNRLLLRKAKYHDLTENIQIGNDTDALHFTLQPNVLAVSFTSNPESARLYVNGKSQGFTSTHVDLPYGKYRVKMKKPGYFTRRRNLSVVAPGQKVHFNLPGTSHFRLGIIYGMDSWGGEIIWAKSSAVGFGLGYYSPPKTESNYTIQHQNIDIRYYPDLELTTPIEQVSNTDSLDFSIPLKVHIFLKKNPYLSIIAGTAVGQVYFSDVYLAHQNYEQYYGMDDIHEGEYYSVGRKGKWKLNPIAGLSLRLLRYFYVSGEVWFNTGQGTQFFTSGGLCFPLN
jgi:hypothetical protein